MAKEAKAMAKEAKVMAKANSEDKAKTENHGETLTLEDVVNLPGIPKPLGVRLKRLNQPNANEKKESLLKKQWGKANASA